MSNRHYIYRLEDKTTGEFYWGSRTCKDIDPKDDKYKGSMISWKPNKKNLVKTDIIEYDTREEANIAEETVITYYINKNLFPLNRNYHIGYGKFCTYGLKHSEEARKKISKASKGRIMSEETRKKISGYKHSEETRKKMSNSLKGKSRKSLSKEHKRRTSKPLSEEHKRKISNSLKGYKRSEEFKKKMSNSLKDKPRKPRSEETRKKISNSLKGKIPWNKGLSTTKFSFLI